MGIIMPTVLDATGNCSPVIGCLRQHGYDTVIRYYSRSEWKRLSQAEAFALARVGIRIGAVYQNRQNQADDFSEQKGESSGADAFDYAQHQIFQPAQSAIYFSVDFDASEAEVNARIIPFFGGVRKAFLAGSGAGGPSYRIGVYGSGRVCRMLRASGSVELSWLAQATGWADFRKYLDSGEWHLKQNMPAAICGLDCDPNETNPAQPDFGAFLIDVAALGPAAPPSEPADPGERATVIARDGLRVRSGPSTEFDVRTVLSFGTVVRVLSRSGDWSLVDFRGDGAADGFCHSSFLRAV